MNRGHLSEYFEAVAVKALSEVEANPGKSNQHEFNGVTQFKEILGGDRLQSLPTSFIYLSDNEPAISEKGFITWYDARENHPARSEYRLYYPTNPVMEKAAPCDLMVLCRKREGGLLIIVANSESTMESQIRWLFGLGNATIEGTISHTVSGESDRDISLVSTFILDEIGISTESKWSDEGLLKCLREKFGLVFPSTRVFSTTARELVGEKVNSLDDPDGALITWLEMEEAMFRTMEKEIVRERLRAGFADDVDAFVAFSLSVHNRRKSRVGYAFENHLEQLFIEHGIKYERGAQTENRAKPDFLFPGAAEYRDPDFPESGLFMLGAKSTCKDRWRQVLSEAARIRRKHLATLEAGISKNQTTEMEANAVRLVIPASIHTTYTTEQQGQLLSLREFLDGLPTNERDSMSTARK